MVPSLLEEEGTEAHVSNHLIDCAALVQDLTPSHKLLLLCLADNSRDGSGRIASPGKIVAMQWTGLSKSSLFEAFSNLTERGLITQHQRGQKGRHAEFLVFPEGCCEVHRRLDRQDLPGLSGSCSPDPEPPVDSPAHRTLTISQGPVSPVSGSGFQDSGSGPPDPFPVVPQESPLHPPGRPAPPKREVEADWTAVFETRAAFDEFVAELRTIRREQDQPTGRWTSHAIRGAIGKALAAGMLASSLPTAFRAVASDSATQLPGRLTAPGPWWDIPEVHHLAGRRKARAEQLEQQRADCSCDHGWLEDDSGRISRCPNCHPASRSSTA